MEHNWNKYLDTTSEYWIKLQALYKANDNYPKKVVKGRNLHHKFLRSWSKKDGEEADNDKENLVSLSEGDHFLAHYYIWKSANKGYRASAVMAVRMMYRKSLKYITSEIAEDIAKVWENKEYVPTKETKSKISAAMRGRQLSESHKAKLSAVRKGKKRGPMSEETKVKMSAVMKGKFHSEEMKAKMSAVRKGKPSPHKGKRRSEETKSKISAAMKGQNKGKHWKLVDGKRVWF